MNTSRIDHDGIRDIIRDMIATGDVITSRKVFEKCKYMASYNTVVKHFRDIIAEEKAKGTITVLSKFKYKLKPQSD